MWLISTEDFTHKNILGDRTLLTMLWTASPLTAAIHQYEKLGFASVESVENSTWSMEGTLF